MCASAWMTCSIALWLLEVAAALTLVASVVAMEEMAEIRTDHRVPHPILRCAAAVRVVGKTAEVWEERKT